MTQSGVYAELFTLQAAAYTDQPPPNGRRHDPASDTLALPRQDTTR